MGKVLALGTCLLLLGFISAANATQKGGPQDYEQFFNRLSSFVAPASLPAQAEPTKSTHAHGFEWSDHCQGKITAIWCNEDKHGMLKDLAYKNDKTGIVNVGCDQREWLNSTAIKALFLADDESVVMVDACRGKKYGYTSITFYTDAGQKLTCGYGQHDYTPDGWDAFSDRYLTYRYGAGDTDLTRVVKTLTASTNNDEDSDDEQAGEDNKYSESNKYSEDEGKGHYSSKRSHRKFKEGHKKRKGRKHHKDQEEQYTSMRNLLVMSDDLDKFQVSDMGYNTDDSDTDSYGGGNRRRSYGSGNRDEDDSKKGRGYGYSRREQHRKDGHHKDSHDDAGWGWKSQCQTYIAPKKPRWSGARDWYKAKGDVDGYGMVGRDSEAYYKFGSKHFYKDPSTYEAHVQKYHDRQDTMGFEPEFYYGEVAPLSKFTMQCDKRDYPYVIHGFCWDDQYKPKPWPQGVVLSTSMTLNALNANGMPIGCPRTPSQLEQFYADLAEISAKLVAASGGIISEVVWQQYTASLCRPADGMSNTTITLGGILVPGEDYTNEDVLAWLNKNTVNGNLCSVYSNAGQSICAGTEFYMIPVSVRGNGTGRAARFLLQAEVKEVQRLLASAAWGTDREEAGLEGGSV